MPDLLSTEELIERVREETQHLTFNGRIDAQLSERTIRYYVTMKYVSPPQRHGGRSMWTNQHVRELVRIRRAQSAGQKLSEIGRAEPRAIDTSWKAANSLVMRPLEKSFASIEMNCRWRTTASQLHKLAGACLSHHRSSFPDLQVADPPTKRFKV